MQLSAVPATRIGPFRFAPRYLNMSAHVAAETQQQGADKWFDRTTWPRSIGSSLLTVAMSQARSTLVSCLGCTLCRSPPVNVP